MDTEALSINNQTKRDAGYVRKTNWIVRIYSLLIIAVLVASDTTNWLEADEAKTLVIILALVLFAQSFTRYFQKHPHLVKWVIAGLVIFLVVGIIVSFLVP